MNRLIVFFIGAIAGAAGTAGVFSSHVVQTNEQWLLVPRAGVNLKDVYADVRKWSLDEWRSHPELARDMVKAGHAEIIKSELIDQAADHAIDRISQRTARQSADDNDDADLDQREPRSHRHRPAVHRSERHVDDFDSDAEPN